MKKYKNFGKSVAGFTLIEMSVILVILSFAAVSMVVSNQDVQKMGKVKSTEETIKKVNKALMKYAKKYKAFPCPAVGFLLTTDANFGVASNVPGDCDSSGSINGIVTSSDGNSYTGGIPIRTLGLKEEDAMDGWNRRLIYVVAKSATLDTTYTDQTNLILLDSYTVVTGLDSSNYDSNYNYTKFSNLPFILMSAGKNGFGAYKRNPEYQSETARIYVTDDNLTSLQESMNHKMRNLSGAGDETDLSNIYVKPRDIVGKFDDIVFAGRRYPASLAYPDFDPRTVDTGNTHFANAIRLVAWYNADDPSSLSSVDCGDFTPITNGDSVVCWRDLSGNANHLISSVAAPTYTASPSNIPTTSTDSAGNVVSFSGTTGDNLGIIDFNLGISSLEMVAPFTIFTVLKNTVWAGTSYIYDNGVATPETSLRTANTTAGRFDSTLGTGSTIQGSPIATDKTNLFVISSVYNGNNSRNYLNGKKSPNASTSSSTAVMNGITVGSDRSGTNAMTGNIAEIIVLKGVVPDKARRVIERMLANKWTDESDTSSSASNNIDMVMQ